jgi:hypothetical protein
MHHPLRLLNQKKRKKNENIYFHMLFHSELAIDIFYRQIATF